MPSPASASTVISPRVSKPRKSTRITLTTLVPPPPETLLSRKKPEMGSWDRVSTAQVSIPAPPPAARANEEIPQPTGRVVSTGVRRGRKYMASSSRTMVTISTDSWVRARSGAENFTKISDTNSPTAPSTMRERSRFWCIIAAPKAVSSNATVTIMLAGSGIVIGTGPVMGTCGGMKPVAPAATAVTTKTNSRRCIEPVSSSRVTAPAKPSTRSTTQR
jgi:hypothetical protein